MMSEIGVKNIDWLLIIGISLAFYSFGRWIFFDLFYLKSSMQVLSLTLICFSLMWKFLRFRAFISWSEILVLACLISAAIGDFLRGELIGALELLICVFLFLSLCIADSRSIILASKALVATATQFAFFAVMITFFVSIGWVNAEEVYIPYATSYEVGSSISRQSSLISFGMVTPFSSFNYFGFDVYRLLAFTSEPARLAIYFGIPLVMALLLGGSWTYCFWIIGTACLLTNSLSVLGPLIFGLVALIVNQVVKLSAYTWIRCAYLVCFITYLVFLSTGDRIVESLVDLRVEAQYTEYDDVVRSSTPVKFASMMLLISDALMSFPLPTQSQVVNGPLLFYVIALGSVICVPLIFVIPLALLRGRHLLAGCARSRSAWFVVLGMWGLAMTFTTSPFFFTPAGIIGITLLFRLMVPMEARRESRDN